MILGNSLQNWSNWMPVPHRFKAGMNDITERPRWGRIDNFIANSRIHDVASSDTEVLKSRVTSKGTSGTPQLFIPSMPVTLWSQVTPSRDVWSRTQEGSVFGSCSGHRQPETSDGDLGATGVIQERTGGDRHAQVWRDIMRPQETAPVPKHWLRVTRVFPDSPKRLRRASSTEFGG
jgi:hypothetical protein